MLNQLSEREKMHSEQDAEIARLRALLKKQDQQQIQSAASGCPFGQRLLHEHRNKQAELSSKLEESLAQCSKRAQPQHAKEDAWEESLQCIPQNGACNDPVIVGGPNPCCSDLECSYINRRGTICHRTSPAPPPPPPVCSRTRLLRPPYVHLVIGTPW